MNSIAKRAGVLSLGIAMMAVPVVSFVDYLADMKSTVLAEPRIEKYEGLSKVLANNELMNQISREEKERLENQHRELKNDEVFMKKFSGYEEESKPGLLGWFGIASMVAGGVITIKGLRRDYSFPDIP